MSFLKAKSINPHLHIFALSLPPLSQQPDTPLQRLNLLARTRRFDDIQTAASLAKEFNFPTLINSTQIIMKNSPKRKKIVDNRDRNLESKRFSKLSKNWTYLPKEKILILKNWIRSSLKSSN